MKLDIARTMLLLFCAASMVAGAPRITTAQPDNSASLVFEAAIPLGNVRGRIDHMAFDLTRQRLFIAELGNNSVGVVDLENRKFLQRISGLKEPQGVGYVPSSDMLYVANAGDGSLRLFHGEIYSDAGRVDLGDDADNIRVDAAADRIIVGYGAGALAVIDAAARTKIAEIPLRAHPESFQIDASSGRAYVNVPNARMIAVLDLDGRKQIAAWATGGASGNFPMALDGESKRALVMFRNPPRTRRIRHAGRLGRRDSRRVRRRR